MRYRAFRTKKNDLYYFQFLTDDGTPVLKSGSFADKAECFEGIRIVMQSAADAGNYSITTNDNGTFSYTLRSADGSIAATSVEYNTVEAAEQSAELLRMEGPGATSKANEAGGEGTASQEATPSAAAPKTTTSSSTTTDDYKPLAFYESRISGVENGFDTFADDNESYFTYNVDGLVLLISEGYSSEKSRDNGIQSVTKNMPLEERYQRAVHTNGQHYFNLRAGNNQEIATSRWFENEAAMNTAIGILTSGGQGGGALRSLFFGGSDKVYIDYKPLAFYQERIGGEEFGFDEFQDSDDYYFTLNHNSKPVLISETYTSAAGRDNGAKSVKKNVKNEKRYVREVHPNGQHYFRLLAGNKQEIATSRWFEDPKEMEKAIAWLLSTGGTRRRKKPERAKKEAAERIYVEQGVSYPCSEVTYDTFQSGGNQKYYFVFKTKEDKAILINGDVRGHDTVESLNKAIAGVVKFAPDDKNYEKKTTKNGKHYFYVHDDEGNSVARSSLFYAEMEEMNEAIKLLACGAGLAKAAPVAAPATKEAIVDDYLPCQAYLAEVSGFHSFQNEKNKEYYFSYNSDGGTTLLRSEGYTTAAARDNGIQSVIKNAPLEERWGTATALNDKYHYYYLRAGNNQEIARSCYYDSEAEMRSDLNWVRGENSTIGYGSTLVGSSLMSAAMIRRQKEEEEAAAARVRAAEEARLAAEAKAKADAEAAAKAKLEEEARLAAEAAAKAAALVAAAATPEKIIDDYMPCDAYAGDEGFYSFYNEEKSEYYFSYNRGDKKTLLRSEGYTTAAARDNGIQSVIKNAPIEERWGTATALNDKYHYYYLRAGNNQEIARSCYYDSAAAMLADWNWVKGEDSSIGMGSALVGGTLMSAGLLSRQKAEEDAAAAALLARQKAEEEARVAAELEAKRKADEEKAAAAVAAAALLASRQKAEEEARVAAELEAKRKADEEKAAAAVAAAALLASRQKADEEARIAAAQLEAKRKADAEKAAAVAAAAAAANLATVQAESTKVYEEDKRGGLGWLWWLLPLLLLALLAFFLMKGCDGCNKPVPPPVVPPIIDTMTVEEPKQPFGPDGAALGFGAGTMEYDMANFLSDANRSFPKTFESDAILFSRNSKTLNSAAKKQLDNLVALLKEYPDVTVDIYGYIDGTESGTYQGSKEVSLDDVRAREVFNYLKSRGIDESRMNYQGAGTNTRRSVDFKLNKR